MADASRPQRRPLRFTTLDDMLADVQRLQRSSYEKAGNWDFAQVCGHLNEWMRYPLDGYPRVGCLVGSILWLMRVTVGKRIVRDILRTGDMPAGTRTMQETVPSPGQDANAAVAQLSATIERWKTHTGTIHPSPLFGALNREDWIKLHLVHGAHHLSFLIPKTESR